MQRQRARNVMLAGAVLLLIWLAAAVLHFLVGIALLAGVVLVIIGVVMYLVSPHTGVG